MHFRIKFISVINVFERFYKPEQEPESVPALSQPEQSEQPEQQQAKRVVKHLPKTGSSVATVINYLFASVTAGIFALVEARKSLRRYSKHARKN